MPRSSEGFLWTPTTTVEGLETDAVVPSKISGNKDYDVIVVGGGFAGLVAARDLSREKLKILIVEARDRIGGRTWTAKALGEEFEMGGTWVHWNQPHLYHELHRYSLHSHLKTSSGTNAPEKQYYNPASGTVREVNPETTSNRMEQIATAFFTFDGHTSRTLMPYPHDPKRTPKPWEAYDHLSIRDRLDQLTTISEADKEEFEAMVSSLGSAPGAQIAFVELLRWYALGGHSMTQMFELAGMYKIGKGGMTNLAIHMLNDFRGDILTKAVVSEICQNEGNNVVLKLQDGTQLKAKGVISTIPLNCLSDITFTPPLPVLHQKAIKTGHINKGAKIHFKLNAEQPWFATSSGRSNSPFCFAFTDHNGTSVASSEPNSTYCIGFGYNDYLDDKKNSLQIINAFKQCFRPNCEVKAYLTHDWMNDPYAKGVWHCWGPKSMSQYLDVLQKPHGRVMFASADWADGWRGFVDGAIESGAKGARDILTTLGHAGTINSRAKL